MVCAIERAVARHHTRRAVCACVYIWHLLFVPLVHHFKSKSCTVQVQYLAIAQMLLMCIPEPHTQTMLK